MCLFSRSRGALLTYRFFLFCVKMDKIRKGSDLREEKWGSLSIQEIKFAANFSIRTVTSLRDISEKTWVHSYPMMSHAFTFHSCENCNF